MVGKIPAMKVFRLLGQLPSVRVIRAGWGTLARQFGLGFRWVNGLMRLNEFAREYRQFRRLNLGTAFALRGSDIVPCLTDRTTTTPVEPTYFLQDAWFARKISERRPTKHVDIASSAKSMALVAQFVPVTFVDIRPVEIELDQFTFLHGSLLALPFADLSVTSLSSLCVIEHIGLGRYGDPLDGLGSEKAAAELRRVLARDGDLYVSVPVDVECRVYFNAHRAFTREAVLALFPGLELVEERYIYGRSLYPAYEPSRGFGTGLFHFHQL